MNVQEEIILAFEGRKKPSALIDPADSEQQSCDTADIAWFEDKDWQTLTFEDWNKHSGAMYFFSRDAFIYFLPSILSLSAKSPNDWLSPTDMLLTMLDRSPTIEYWDALMSHRIVGLRKAEYLVLKKWLLYMVDHSNLDQDSLGRAFDTISLAEIESNKQA